jgi:hypothetical protein
MWPEQSVQNRTPIFIEVFGQALSFAKIGEARNAGRLAPVDGIESGKDMGPCTF